MREAGNAGLRTAGHIPANIRRLLSGGLDSAEVPTGPFESRALSVISAYEQADEQAEAAVARVRRVWSELPLIVLAGLR